MVTKEQALTTDYFIQVHKFDGEVKLIGFMQQAFVPNGTTSPLDKPIKWRRNGKTKVWKSADRAEHFRVPVKYGLRTYGYIEYTFAEDNRVLFEVAL